MGLAASPELGLGLKLPLPPPPRSPARRTVVRVLLEAAAAAGEGRVAKLEELLHGLEEERRKIQCFPRELPLCTVIVCDAIEDLEEELARCGGGNCAAHPKMEQFIPNRKFEEAGRSKDEEDRREKASWMSSAQLWSDTSSTSNSGDTRTDPERSPEEEDDRLKCLPAASCMNGMAAAVPRLSVLSFLPPAALLPPSPQQPPRKARRCWSPELHRRFVDALHRLGGLKVATPKQIRELMKVDGLTNDEVKSHLQKYRLHARRTPAISVQANQSAVKTGMSVVDAHSYEEMEEEDGRSESYIRRGPHAEI
ncbi:unnamed protein product [Spirodela intermedia]|uniref:HTH myb-type domain-containing protein n=1 Tax=Spirodela intermedia TaxID=51605 RepID=A0A7I8JBB7_SPIIN|nr:unnamed protein product [Spirodela intermedia]CAA6667498.1 unnamed protein product [Spirodela intermedia]